MFRSRHTIRILAVPILLLAGPTLAEDPYQLLLLRQMGTGASDEGLALATNSQGHVYLAGVTQAALAGTHLGGRDAFLVKFDEQGQQLWSRQIGTSAEDRAAGLATDPGGDVVVVGWTEGALRGPNAGADDAFIARYSDTGDLLWMQQFGTHEDDWAMSAAIGTSGSTYVTGITWGNLSGVHFGHDDAFLAKYDESGSLLWVRQIGTSRFEGGFSVALDAAENAYVTGYSALNLFAPNPGEQADVILMKYDASGDMLWGRQVGSWNGEHGAGVAVDSQGNAYVAGTTFGSLPSGGPGPSGPATLFLLKYGPSGDLVWLRQRLTTSNETVAGVGIDEADGIYVGGHTSGTFGGPHAGSLDGFLAKYTASGAPVWDQQFGSARADWTVCMAMAEGGEVLLGGYTLGDLAGPNAGEYDAFFAKYGPDNCYADCDNSTILDIFDFLCFQDAFLTGNAYADCDGNRFLEFFDYLCFQDAFVTGCP